MAYTDKAEHNFTCFDDVDLCEAENHCNLHSISDLNNAVAQQNNEHYLPKDIIESATSLSGNSKSNAETEQIEEKTNAVEAEGCTSSAEVHKYENTDDDVVTATHTSMSVHHFLSLSAEVVNLDVKTLPSVNMACDGSDLETSTAVLTLDSDTDSPQRCKTYCDLDSGDGMEVDVAALQLQLSQLTAERDSYKSLYSQCKEENDNYQEQILEVWPDLYITIMIHVNWLPLAK